jgi:hypothetical protein
MKTDIDILLFYINDTIENVYNLYYVESDLWNIDEYCLLMNIV